MEAGRAAAGAARRARRVGRRPLTGALLAVPFGLVIGLSLGLVGGGGSILAVPVLIYVLGEEPREATTASLLIVGTTALVGALDHARSGRVRWHTGLSFGVAGALGALGGTALNRRTDEDEILFLFSLLLLVAAIGMLRSPSGPHATQAHEGHLWPRVAPVGVGIGVLTGFFGVGGGFLIVPALALLLGVPMAAAVGTSLLVIALTSAAGLAAHLATGSLDWTLAGAFTGAAIVGALAGSRFSARLPAGRLRHLVAVLLVAVAAVLLAESMRTLL